MSSAPAHGYDADRLADDVLSVLDTLRLDRVILVGHSIAGQELSSIASRFPHRTAGVVYLDAAYGFAYYDETRGHIGVDLAEVSRTLTQLAEARDAPQSAESVSEIRATIRQLLERGLPGLARNLREYDDTLAAMSAPATAPQPRSFQPAVGAIWAGVRKQSAIAVPALAIFAVPRQVAAAVANDPTARTAAEAADAARFAQADAFERGVPNARVVRIAHASHFVFVSHETEVLREMRAFLSRLK
jgi:pimeloyl-ACP methyl ester carboxylesterase